MTLCSHKENRSPLVPLRHKTQSCFNGIIRTSGPRLIPAYSEEAAAWPCTVATCSTRRLQQQGASWSSFPHSSLPCYTGGGRFCSFQGSGEGWRGAEAWVWMGGVCGSPWAWLECHWGKALELHDVLQQPFGKPAVDLSLLSARNPVIHSQLLSCSLFNPALFAMN